MVEQVWYTRATTGLRGGVGHQPRAATAGLRDVTGERFRRLEPLLRYRLPGGVNEYLVPMGRAPIGLTLRRVGEDWALVRRQPVVPEERLAKRFYFTHALTWRGDAIGAREAIALWDWSGWRTAETGLGEGEFGLAPLASTELRATAGEAARGLREILRAGKLQDELGYMIAAYLALGPGQRLFVAAEPARVAALIYGLLNALPAGLTAGPERAQAAEEPTGPTFSTYEPVDAILEDGAPTIVGTCWWLEHGGRAAGLAADELPPACSGARGIALHDFRPVPDQREWPGDQAIAGYARYAATALTGGDETELARFLAEVEARGVTTLHDLATWDYRWRGALTVEDVSQLAEQPPLLRSLLWRKEVRERLIDLAGGPPGGAREMTLTTARALAAEARTLATRQARTAEGGDEEVVSALRTLGEESLSATARAIAGEQTERAQGIFEGLVVMLAGGRYERACAALFDRVAEIPQDWSLRSWLIERWALADPPVSDGAIAAWLAWAESGPEQIWPDAGRVLGLALPARWRELAMRQAVMLHGGMPLPLAAVEVLGKERALAVQTLPALAEREETAAGAIAFARSLAQLERTGGPVTPGQSLTNELLLTCLERHSGRGIVRAIVGSGLLDRQVEEELLADWLPELVRAFGRDATLGRLVGEYLRGLRGDTLLEVRTAAILESLYAARSTLALTRQDQQWLLQGAALSHALAGPSFEEQTLAALAGAIRDTTWTRLQIEQLLATYFGKRIRTTPELERVVRIIGPVLLGEDETWRMVKLLAEEAKRADLLGDRWEVYWDYAKQGQWTEQQRARIKASLYPLVKPLPGRATRTATRTPAYLPKPRSGQRTPPRDHAAGHNEDWSKSGTSRGATNAATMASSAADSPTRTGLLSTVHDGEGQAQQTGANRPSRRWRWFAVGGVMVALAVTVLFFLGWGRAAIGVLSLGLAAGLVLLWHDVTTRTHGTSGLRAARQEQSTATGVARGKLPGQRSQRLAQVFGLLATVALVGVALWAGWWFWIGNEKTVTAAAIVLLLLVALAVLARMRRLVPASGAAEVKEGEAKLLHDLLISPPDWPLSEGAQLLTAQVGDYLDALRIADLRRPVTLDILQALGGLTGELLPEEWGDLVADWSEIAQFTRLPSGDEERLRGLTRAICGFQRQDRIALAELVLPPLGEVAEEALRHEETFGRLGEALLGSKETLLANLIRVGRGREAEACVKYALRITLPQERQRSEAEAVVLQQAVQEWRGRASRRSVRRVEAVRESLGDAGG